MKQKLVSIIIVSWNGIDHLKKCLPSTYAQKYKAIEVILVDNGSSDATVIWTRNNYPTVQIIPQKINLGFAEGNNIGYKYANGEYVLFLNNDTEVSKDFLTELVLALEKNSALGGVQSKILFMENPKKLDNVGSFLTSTGFLYHHGIFQEDSEEFNKQKIIYSAKGACMLFRKKVLEETLVDGEVFDSRFFAYFEETDLCHRVWLAGYKIMFIPTSKILHKFGATSIKLLKPFVEYHSYKNRINSYLKNLGLLNLIKILVPHIVICMMLSGIFLLKGKFGIFLAIQKAIWWNFVHIVTTLRKRYIVQHTIRKVKDDAFFMDIMMHPRLAYFLSQLKGWNVDQITNTNE